MEGQANILLQLQKVQDPTNMKTHPLLIKFNARFNKIVFDGPNLSRIEVRGAYGCCTLSSKFRVVSSNSSASSTRS